MEWHQSYDKIKPYTLRIDSETGFGTGFLFAYNKNKEIAAIATAAHVVKDVNGWRKPLKLIHYQSKTEIFLTADMRAIWIDSERDTATIIINAKILPLPEKTLPLLKPTHYIKIGVEVGWTGFPAIAPHSLCFFSGKISSFLEAPHSYLIDGVAINGVSGGPVFRNLIDTPEIIGIVSAYRPNRRPTDTLPGLLIAQDVTSVHKHLTHMNNLDEAKEEEKKQKRLKPENNASKKSVNETNS